MQENLIKCFKLDYENLYTYTAAVMKLHLSKKNNPLLILKFFKTFSTTHFEENHLELRAGP